MEYLNQAETLFWKDLLDKYLYPIDENKEEQVCNQCDIIGNFFQILNKLNIFAFLIY